MSRSVVIIVVLLMLVATPILPWSGAPVEASWCSPWIDHLEFTQGVQQGLDPLDPVMDPALPPGSDQPEPVVPLIKNRALAVRAYVRSLDFCDPDEVWMTLYAENNGQQVWDRLNMATRGAVKYDPIPYWNRTNDAETFNVRMWPQEDSLTFEACVGTWVCQGGSPPPGSANHCEMEETPQCVTQTVAFESREQPSIAGMPINYRAAEFEPNGPPSPSDEQYISEGYAERIAEALWPLPDGPGGYDYCQSSA